MRNFECLVGRRLGSRDLGKARKLFFGDDDLRYALDARVATNVVDVKTNLYRFCTADSAKWHFWHLWPNVESITYVESMG